LRFYKIIFDFLFVVLCQQQCGYLPIHETAAFLHLVRFWVSQIFIPCRKDNCEMRFLKEKDKRCFTTEDTEVHRGMQRKRNRAFLHAKGVKKCYLFVFLFAVIFFFLCVLCALCGENQRAFALYINLIRSISSRSSGNTEPFDGSGAERGGAEGRGRSASGRVFCRTPRPGTSPVPACAFPFRRAHELYFIYMRDGWG